MEEGRPAWIRQGVFVLECQNCTLARAHYSWRVIIPPLRCLDPHALGGTRPNQTPKVFTKVPQLSPRSHGLPICPQAWGPWGDGVRLYQPEK